MAHALPHICVLICTYKRPQMLARLLDGLVSQDTGGLFTYSVVVADNDQHESAERSWTRSRPRATFRSRTAWSRGRTSR